MGFLGAIVINNPPADAGDLRDVGSIPVLGKPLGEGNGDPLQDSCLENPIDRGAWQATVHSVAQNQKMQITLSKNIQ